MPIPQPTQVCTPQVQHKPHQTFPPKPGTLGSKPSSRLTNSRPLINPSMIGIPFQSCDNLHSPRIPYPYPAEDIHHPDEIPATTQTQPSPKQPHDLSTTKQVFYPTGLLAHYPEQWSHTLQLLSFSGVDASPLIPALPFLGPKPTSFKTPLPTKHRASHFPTPKTFTKLLQKLGQAMLNTF